ncbi:tRNA dimethylallyltransferase [Pseudoruegeria aquimaris]|uniref:tRNA dimethylallyltransferase n=1 Tax=Pseudoruegeria aquimaris TaxID=393663 RepID=A0A1Y5S9T9_9RHOB|nr:tRNA (adenosine(37)-N6)-dimethylallyltransferase MiaA [Pseudoruegeria aquimaris]SLN34613.1 tRNA dimethylallyltransferase [Pseudoruegeria aquimaris]
MSAAWLDRLPTIPRQAPVLIAGPTASGKSALALAIAERDGGVIVNADALQVYDGWHILTARPPAEDLARARHELYGHVPHTEAYSVGHWLRDLAPILRGAARPIIVGGTGLYFEALTRGLAEIPETPAQVRAEADARRIAGGVAGMLAELDAATRARIDPLNPMRVQRAWEVLRATGRGLAEWQADTPPPLLPLQDTFPIVMRVERDWLNARIDRRFDMMMEMGALAEAEAMRPGWDPARLSSRAIGAAELIAHLNGEMTLPEAVAAAKLASRQYAKRQRTWFRSKMAQWHPLALPAATGPA